MPGPTDTETVTETKQVTPAVCREAIDLADDVISALRKGASAYIGGNSTRATAFIGRANALQEQYADAGQECYGS